VRGQTAERIDAPPVARQRERRTVTRNDRAATAGDVGAPWIAGIGVEPRRVDERDL
jgi:hypothetical protein